MRIYVCAIFLLSLAFNAQAKTTITGKTAQDLFKLMPGKEMASPQGYPGIDKLKIAGQVLCTLRTNKTYKCLAPNKNPDNKIELDEETSGLFCAVLSAGCSALLGETGHISCTMVQRADSQTTYPSCFIKL